MGHPQTSTLDAMPGCKTRDVTCEVNGMLRRNIPLSVMMVVMEIEAATCRHPVTMHAYSTLTSVAVVMTGIAVHCHVATR